MKLKYILITLFLRRAFSRPFIIILLACHRGPRVPRTDGAKVERGGEPHNRFPNISRKNPCFWEKMAQQQRGWAVHGYGVSFFTSIDMLMPNTSIVFLWINKTGYFLIIEDEPLINNRAFVELVWGIKATGERFEQRATLAEQSDAK